MRRALAIILLSIGAAILYGLVHDQITIRVSPEYFTVLHPQILPDDTPLTVLALAWGILATWWVGLILGVILAGAACLGNRPTISAAQLVRPIGILLALMAVGATLSGVTGYLLAVNKMLVLNMLPPDQDSRATAAWFTHLASYGLGFIGGITLAVWTWRSRGRIARHP